MGTNGNDHPSPVNLGSFMKEIFFFFNWIYVTIGVKEELIILYRENYYIKRLGYGQRSSLRIIVIYD